MKSILLLSLLLTLLSCRSAGYDFNITGHVQTASGEPSIGLQGIICVQVKTKDFMRVPNEYCNRLYTDNNGNYHFDQQNFLYGFIFESLDVESVVVTLGDESGYNVQTIKKFDLTKGNHFNSSNFDFTNKLGNPFGVGRSIETLADLCGSASKSLCRKLILDFIKRFNDSLNVAEILMLLINYDYYIETNETSPRDQLIMSYINLNLKKLSRADILRLADRVNTPATKDKIIQLSYETFL